MRHAEKKKEKDKIAIVLMLCFCVIALTSIFTIRSSISKINDSGSNVPVSDRIAANPGADPAKPSQNPSPNAAEDKKSAESSARIPTVDSRSEGSAVQPDVPPQPSGNVLFCHPVHAAEAYVTNKFSMDSLIYSVTLDQYMTHCGVDIEAPADTQVLSMADGTVTAVYVDDRYGNSVEITHNSQFTAIYSNLSDAHMVEIGDTVTAGQIIGGIGMTGLFESLEPAHLHLELLKDGVYVDPMEYIG